MCRILYQHISSLNQLMLSVACANTVCQNLFEMLLAFIVFLSLLLWEYFTVSLTLKEKKPWSSSLDCLYSHCCVFIDYFKPIQLHIRGNYVLIIPKYLRVTFDI